MSDLQIVVLLLLVPIVLLALSLAGYVLPRLLPPNRAVIRIAADRIPALTGRPLRRFVGVDVAGRNGACFYLQASFADVTTFGTDAGPPRSYFVYSVTDGTLSPITPAEARPHKYRSSWC